MWGRGAAKGFGRAPGEPAHEEVQKTGKEVKQIPKRRRKHRSGGREKGTERSSGGRKAGITETRRRQMQSKNGFKNPQEGGKDRPENKAGETKPKFQHDETVWLSFYGPPQPAGGGAGKGAGNGAGKILPGTSGNADNANNADNENNVRFAPSTAETAQPEPEDIDVRLPERATVVDEQGARIGKVRDGIWYDKKDEPCGEFVKESTNVFVYKGSARTGYLDKNDNILTMNNRYVATLRRPNRARIAVAALLVVLLTALTFVLSAYFMLRSENYYAPVLFIATENGASWEESEDLPVFFNDKFGDEKAYPGMSGSYRFVFENRNADKLEYSLRFVDQNEYGIEIVYRLKRDNSYIAGASGYVRAEELGREALTIEPESSTVFELEWYWRDNDAADTAAGENGAVYRLKISLSAHVFHG